MASVPAKTIREATKDWHRRFPQFALGKPRWLVRRVGPSVQGILLNPSDGKAYRPISFLHPLFIDWEAKEPTLLFSTVYNAAGLAEPPDRIPFSQHAELFEAAADRLERTSPTQLVGPLDSTDLIDFGRARLRQLAGYQMFDVFEAEFAVGVAAVSGQSELAEELAAEAVTILHSLVTDGHLEASQIAEDIEQLHTMHRDPELLQRNIEKQIIALGISDLPN